jgi:hypothetical protein
VSSQEIPPGGGGEPSEDELRAAYEAELARINVTDLIAQTTVSLLNLAARRLAPAAPQEGGAPFGDGRDLEQARDAIDGVRALLEILERRMPGEVRPLREALSQLQMAYAREAAAEGPAPAEGASAGEEQLGGSGPEGGERGGKPGGTSGEGSGGAPPGGAAPPPDAGSEGRRPGPAESSGRLWVPGR